MTGYRILLPTDVFPPRCGGAGWSAHALALALLARGHQVLAVVPRQGPRGTVREDVLGVPTLRWGYAAPEIPFVKNYYRHERTWQPLADLLLRLAQEPELWHSSAAPSAPSFAADHNPLIIHAQHVQVAPAAMIAARRMGVPALVNIRDHWPWDYFATGQPNEPLPPPAPTYAALAADLVRRFGPARGAAMLPALPYIVGHMRRRQAFLRQADAVICGSGYIAARAASVVDPARVHVIPNIVDLAAIDRTIAQPPPSAPPSFLLFVGKLEPNKGAQLLPAIFAALTAERRAALPPLLLCGSGPLRPALERDLAALGVTARFLDWADHDEVLRLMARCALLLFPSNWGEPLSRTLLEASACGAPILAMPTGGTPDIIQDGVNGALAADVPAFALRLAALLADQPGRRALGASARRAAQRYAPETVAAQVEALYAR